MLEPSNLGQIIGRALYGEPEPRARGEALSADTPRGGQAAAPKYGKWTPNAPRCRGVVEFVRKARRGVSSAEVADACDLDQPSACNILVVLVTAGELVRSGTRGQYRYSLAKASAP